MNFIKLLCVAALASLAAACTSLPTTPAAPASSATAATLQIPASVTLLSVDGVKAKLPLVRPGTYYYQLSPGAHNVALSYGANWGKGDRSELIRSDIYNLAVQAQAGQILRIEHTLSLIHI